MNNDINPDLTGDELADWFDAILDGSWTRRFADGGFDSETWFTLGPNASPQARIVIGDAVVTVHEFDDKGWLVATSKFSGDMRRQAPRVLQILGIED